MEQNLHFSVSGVFQVALNYALLEVSVEAEDVAIQLDPVRLV